jgi:peptidoglycan/LPS O-acetylase OafA/YrhL
MDPPLERDPRYRLLDTWRGVACLMVVLHHAGFAVVLDLVSGDGWESWLREGVIGLLWRMNLGVPLFFVISGYCIGASADATRRRGSGAWAFLARRFWRIYPPYWAAVLWFVAVTAGLDALGLTRWHYGQGRYALQLDSPSRLDAIQWLGNLTLTEEWRPLAWRPPPKRIITRIAWSLCYEEQFYFVCFLALLLAPRRLYRALAAVTIVAVSLCVVLADAGALQRIAGAFPTLWHEFAVGLAVYWRLNVPAPAWAKRGVELGLVGLLGIGLYSAGPSTPVEFSTAAAAAFGLALIALRDRDEAAERARWLAPLRACGRRCYSIYLVHLPVCTVVNLWLVERGLVGFWARALLVVPISALAAVGVSWVFFRVVERHFLNPPIVRKDPRSRAGTSSGPPAGEASGPGRRPIGVAAEGGKG